MVEKKQKSKKEAVKAKGEQAVVNIGMVGHVDHGKTSLTEALSGKWTDTHSEELKRGISIRLGYADTVFYKCKKCKGAQAFSSTPECKACNGKAEKLRKVSFVDAPGHETLMATMLSGAALMHGAVLVIAANEECPQPRTVEHLMALRLSGVENLVVAQNKVDLVSKEDAKKNYLQIKEFLKEQGFENAPVVPTAASFGSNIDVLIQTIEEHIPTPDFDLSVPLKMYVARSFDINKPGTKPDKLKGGVIGGTIVQGKVKKGDKIIVSPGFESGVFETTVVSVGTENGLLEEGKPGGLIALGTELDPAIAQNDRMRGQIVAKPGSIPDPVTKAEFEIQLIKRIVADGVKEIKVNDSLMFSIGTMTTVGTAVKKTGKNSMEFVFKLPAVIEKGQRIALSKMDNMQWRLVAFGICK